MDAHEITQQVASDLHNPHVLRAEFERRGGEAGGELRKYHSPVALAFAQALGLDVPENVQPEPTVCRCGVCDPCMERIGNGFT